MRRTAGLDPRTRRRLAAAALTSAGQKQGRGSFAQPTIELGWRQRRLNRNDGGAVRLIVDGTLTVDGTIAADGVSGPQATSSGSGGSLWITAGQFAGSGNIHADGGLSAIWPSQDGHGGGGRIALYYTTSSYSGSVTAYGGTSYPGYYNGGGAGSVHLAPAGVPSTTIYDNGGHTQSAATEIHGATNYENLVVRGQAWLIHPSQSVDGLRVSVSGDATIESAGRIDVSGLGYPGGQGPGAGGTNGSYYEPGGGYGGRGADFGGARGGTTGPRLVRAADH